MHGKDHAQIKKKNDGVKKIVHIYTSLYNIFFMWNCLGHISPIKNFVKAGGGGGGIYVRAHCNGGKKTPQIIA